MKEYAELANPKPLTIAGVQALLNDGEALVLFLEVPQFGKLPGETLVWVVTRADTRWARIDLASQALAERVAALRCGLDGAAWNGEGALRCAEGCCWSASRVSLHQIKKRKGSGTPCGSSFARSKERTPS